ncbi:hypothetical protein [Streptomyces sp. AM8-1-1]|uniref:hypothetical protein n=1 Tax=Streptomyces sp. AM8-1-1 TaxID=3075825 RepID=UPI0028C46D85|nr:hypothetical protein [Streptomyces sp. AM8-1-1]WNO76844.1 hypothetical protein RPQ07_36775 [Streptomyces sp. AM8-1-1]
MMDDAKSAELRVSEPLDADEVPQGRDLAEYLHHDEFPGLVRFLLLQGASWSEAQDALLGKCAGRVRMSVISERANSGPHSAFMPRRFLVPAGACQFRPVRR